MNVAEAWRASAGHSGTVVLLALMTFALSLLLQLPASLDAPEPGAAPGPIGFVYGLVTTWILLMLGVTLLSTL